MREEEEEERREERRREERGSEERRGRGRRRDEREGEERERVQARSHVHQGPLRRRRPSTTTSPFLLLFLASQIFPSPPDFSPCVRDPLPASRALSLPSLPPACRQDVPLSLVPSLSLPFLPSPPCRKARGKSPSLPARVSPAGGGPRRRGERGGWAGVGAEVARAGMSGGAPVGRVMAGLLGTSLRSRGHGYHHTQRHKFPNTPILALARPDGAAGRVWVLAGGVGGGVGGREGGRRKGLKREGGIKKASTTKGEGREGEGG